MQRRLQRVTVDAEGICPHILVQCKYLGGGSSLRHLALILT